MIDEGKKRSSLHTATQMSAIKTKQKRKKVLRTKLDVLETLDVVDCPIGQTQDSNHLQEDKISDLSELDILRKKISTRKCKGQNFNKKKKKKHLQVPY